jgi:hypothetical protein
MDMEAAQIAPQPSKLQNTLLEIIVQKFDAEFGIVQKFDPVQYPQPRLFLQREVVIVMNNSRPDIIPG